MSDNGLVNMFVAAKSGTIVRGKIMSMETVPAGQAGHTRSIPRGIDTSAPSRRTSGSSGREHPVGIKSSGVSFDPATEPESLSTLEPKSPL
jgi:hypothetical protein